MKDVIYREDVIDTMRKLEPSFKGSILEQALKSMPSTQPDDRLVKIAELVDGSIDHFDLDDAMDLLYQIKNVLR